MRLGTTYTVPNNPRDIGPQLRRLCMQYDQLHRVGASSAATLAGALDAFVQLGLLHRTPGGSYRPTYWTAQRVEDANHA